jgi:branched-chain amino acid transport system substrate-binding protein
MRSKITRTTLTGAFSLLLLAALCLGGPVTPALAEDEVVFATVDDLSGPYAESGDEGVKAVLLALEDYNYKILGKKIRYVKRDTQLKPAIGVRKFRELVDQEKNVVFVQSGCSSAVQLAMQQVAKDTKTLFWTQGWDSTLTSAGVVNRYTFRWDSPNYAIANSSVAGFMQKFPDAKTYFSITMDYAWGHDMYKQFEAVVKRLGGKVLGNVLTPINESDYSSSITQALSAKPDVVVLNLYGAPLIKCGRAVAEFGVKDRAKVLIPADGLTMLRGIGAEALQGMYVGTHWWHTADTEFSKKLTARFKAKYNVIPSYYVAANYVGALMTLQAMERCGSTKAEDVICALEGWKYDGPSGKEEIRAFDHQVVHPFLLGYAKKPSEMKYKDDYLDIIASASVYRTYEQNPVKWELKLPCDK